MAVMARETWTDERIDDLKGEMNQRFDQVDKRFDRFEGQIRELRGEVKSSQAELKGEIAELRGDIKGMQRLMVQGFVAFCAVMVSGFFALAGLTAF